MFCSQCGARLRSASRYCEECGTPRARGTAVAQAVEDRMVVMENREDALVPYSAGGPVVVTGGSAQPAPPPAQAQGIQITPWAVGIQQGGQGALATPAQAIQFNPNINVAVTAPPAPVVAPAVNTVVVVDSHDGFALATAGLWALGVAASLGMTGLIITAFVLAHGEVFLLFVLPLLCALFFLAFSGAARRRL